MLDWYHTHKRDYPWRQSRDSYRVWVAEVMLQQTRIAVVVPAYERFIETFPTLDTLAKANQDTVLSLWSGLGYYTRARSLHQAARTLVSSGQSAFPSDYAAARQLPGIGPYTAAAVTSIAYGLAHAAVDGNIVRVLSRLQCLAAPGARGEPYTSTAQELLDPTCPGDWNQALMELGQHICLPKAPQCTTCPLRHLCKARRADKVDQFPPRRLRRTREHIDLDLTVVRDDAQRLLLERGAFTYLPHLWLPPTHRFPDAREVAEIKHSIVHRDFRVRVFEHTVSGKRLQQLARPDDAVERRLVTPAELMSLGRSSLLTKALRVLPV